MAKYVLVASSLALLAATIAGARTGNWNYLSYVWWVVGPLVGAVIMHYFMPQNE